MHLRLPNIGQLMPAAAVLLHAAVRWQTPQAQFINFK
jgi:hypothetical protein